MEVDFSSRMFARTACIRRHFLHRSGYFAQDKIPIKIFTGRGSIYRVIYKYRSIYIVFLASHSPASPFQSIKNIKKVTTSIKRGLSTIVGEDEFVLVVVAVAVLLCVPSDVL